MSRSRRCARKNKIGKGSDVALIKKRFKLSARVSSDNPSAIKPVLERIIGSNGLIKSANEEFRIEAELEGESARDLNRMFLSELRKVERRMRLRAEWTAEGVTERFFDYVPKGRKRLERKEP